MTTTLVLSPHLDDAVLSLGGRIAAWVRDGPVVIATVYHRGPPLDEVAAAMRPFADYATRCREDDEAAALLGATTRRLGHVELAFRGRALGMADIFTTPASRDGFTERAAIVESLDGLAELAPDRIAVPLGIGNHADHVETVVAATDWLVARGWVERAVFYEDFYALCEPMRAAHWLARRRRWWPWQAPLLRARTLGAMLRTIAAARHGPPIEDYLAPVWRAAAWTVTPASLGADEPTKLAAIACYRTQTEAFGGLAGIRCALQAYHRYWGCAEPLWARDRVRRHGQDSDPLDDAP